MVSCGGAPEQAIPCTAALIQRELGLADAGVPCFDVNATCLGFVAALEQTFGKAMARVSRDSGDEKTKLIAQMTPVWAKFLNFIWEPLDRLVDWQE